MNKTDTVKAIADIYAKTSGSNMILTSRMVIAYMVESRGVSRKSAENYSRPSGSGYHSKRKTVSVPPSCIIYHALQHGIIDFGEKRSVYVVTDECAKSEMLKACKSVKHSEKINVDSYYENAQRL